MSARAICSLLWLVWAATAGVNAATAACARPVTDRPKIGLVLGGGGARGSAHIGVIRVLQEMNIPVDYVVGTSMGALVAALFATGMTADELERVMMDIDWGDVLRDETARQDQPFRRKRDDNLALFGPKLGISKGMSMIGPGAISGQKISFLFERLITERTQSTDFDRLPIPYRAVAADLATGEQVVLDKGDVATAMRSSMSVPGLFDPVVVNGHLLVDGGIVNNVPVDVVRDMGADVVIAVNVGTGLTPKEKLNNSLAIIVQMTNLLIQANVNKQLGSLTSRDVLISPPLGDLVSSGDFQKAATAITIGYQEADRMRHQLAGLSVSDEQYADYRAQVLSCVSALPRIDFVRLDNTSRFDDAVIRKRLTIKPGAPLDTKELDRNIRQIHALGFIDLARYEVVEEGGKTGVVVHVRQDDRGSRFLEWGLDYAGDLDDSSVNLRVGYLNTAVDQFGSELRVVAQLGEDPGALLDLYKYVNPRLKLFLEPQLYAVRTDFTSYDKHGDQTLVADVTKLGASMAIGREISRHANLLLGVRSFWGKVEQKIGVTALNSFDFQGGEYFAQATYDRLDDRYFPGDGGLLDIQFQRGDKNLGSDDEYDQLQLNGLIARSYSRHTFMAGARYYETLDHVAPVYAVFRAGGFARLSGLEDDQISGQNFAMILGGYRYHFAGSGLLPAYLGGTLEYGEAADNRDDLFSDALWNGSLYFGYRSPIGPLYLGVGLSEGGVRRYFLRIGNVFGNASFAR